MTLCLWLLVAPLWIAGVDLFLTRVLDIKPYKLVMYLQIREELA